MYSETMRLKGFIEIDLHIDYMSALDHVLIKDEVQPFWVAPLEPNHFLIKESSGLLFEYKLFFGDEILVEQIDEKNYQLKSAINPSAMRHFFFIGSGHPTALTAGLHELGDEWECDMGGLTTIHIPKNQIDAFQARFDFDPRPGCELFNGVQPAD